MLMLGVYGSSAGAAAEAVGVGGHAGDHMQVQVQQQDQSDHRYLLGIHIAVDNMGDGDVPIATATDGHRASGPGTTGAALAELIRNCVEIATCNLIITMWLFVKGLPFVCRLILGPSVLSSMSLLYDYPVGRWSWHFVVDLSVYRPGFFCSRCVFLSLRHSVM